MKCHKKPENWTDSTDKCPKTRRMDIIFGTWNVRSLCRADLQMTVVKELSKYKLDLVCVQEVQ
jgi:hypothetical protein